VTVNRLTGLTVQVLLLAGAVGILIPILWDLIERHLYGD
jgi:hypothetical protein